MASARQRHGPGQHGADLSQARGIDVREQINQGFVRSELGTVADDKATRVYEAPEISPALLERHATTAVDNYLAAISCFLRAVPTVKDTRSKKLLREHVNRLLRRLEGMRKLIAEAKRLHALNGGDPVRLAAHEKINYVPGADFDPSRYRAEFDAELAAAFDELTEEAQPVVAPVPDPIDTSNMHSLGARIEVLDPASGRWEPAVVAGHDATDKYHVRFADGTDESNVDASRVRAPRPPSPAPAPVPSPPPAGDFDLSDIPKADVPRFEAMSEIIESERKYVLDLDNLLQFYVKALQNPAHWGGQKQQAETWFSQKTLNEQEAKEIFCNITDIAAMNNEFLGELETAFANMQVDQSLATVFVEFAPRFELYTDYIVGFQEAIETIERMRNERMGFRSAEEAAQRASVAPLKTLMRRPVDRIKGYTKLLHKLQDRTDPSHPSIADIHRALDIFQRVEEYMRRALDMRANQKHVKVIEGMFQPKLSIAHPKRVYLHEGKLERMEKKGPKKWNFWLFNDIIICGRESEWLARGYYRHEGTLQLRCFGSDLNYGPFAISVRSKDGDVWILLCPDHLAKADWLAKFALCPGVFNQDKRLMQDGRPVLEHRDGPVLASRPAPARTPVAAQSSSPPPPPPPPPPPRAADALPPGWVQLTDPSSGKVYYFNESQSKTQWEKP